MKTVDVSKWQGTGDALHLPLKSTDFSLVGEDPKPLGMGGLCHIEYTGKEEKRRMFETCKNEKTETVAVTENQPKKRRKPQDRSKLTRNSQVQIRLTETEVTTLKAAAKENDMSLADFVMSGIHQRRRIVVPGAGELRSEIIRVGTNLNQALRLAYIQKKEGQKVDMKSMETATNQVKEVLEKLQDWLTTWDVYLVYKKEKGDK